MNPFIKRIVINNKGGLIMRKLMFVMMLIFFLICTKVSATSWVELMPEEVYGRSELIVLGVYHFSEKPKSSGSMFQGREFEVSNVYKGEASEKIIAGIDGFDEGWADEFQRKGGQFLLFLEKKDDTDFLTPVGGPNGMIQVMDGEVQEEKQSKKEFYQNILEKPIAEPTVTEPNPKPTSNKILYGVVMGVLVSILIGFLIFRK